MIIQLLARLLPGRMISSSCALPHHYVCLVSHESARSYSAPCQQFSRPGLVSELSGKRLSGPTLALPTAIKATIAGAVSKDRHITHVTSLENNCFIQLILLTRAPDVAAAVRASLCCYCYNCCLALMRYLISSGDARPGGRVAFAEVCRSGFDNELGTFELAPSLALLPTVALPEPFPLSREDVEYLEELCWEAKMFYTRLMYS